jgi:hypothetical protein
VTSDLAFKTKWLRSKFAREIEFSAREAGMKAVGGKTPAAEVERIRALQCLLSALPEKTVVPLKLALLVGIACLLFASLALSLRIPWTRVQFDITTTSIVMRLKNDLSWHGAWKSKQVFLRNFTRIDLPPDYGPRHETTLEMTASKGRVRIDDLFFDHGALLTIAVNDGAADIKVSDATFRGDLDVSGDLSGRTGASLDANLPFKQFDPDNPPGPFHFIYNSQVAGAPQPPALFDGTLAESFALSDISVTSLSFEEEHPKPGLPEQISFMSQITSGTVTMTDSTEEITLSPESALRLTNVRGRITALQLTPDGVRAKFEGTASEVSLGTGDFARNLKLTVLEWAFHQQKLALFWGALTFLWGVIWSTRRLFAGVT